jgi:hypothetical protein
MMADSYTPLHVAADKLTKLADAFSEIPVCVLVAQ